MPQNHNLEDYIMASWEKLRRNALDVARDPKIESTRRSYLYIPPKEDPAKINAMINERLKHTDGLGGIEVRPLPENFIVENDHGILYLPHDYIVPGGRFNEMYAWDSYWIILGLLQDGFAEMAKGIVENFIYQIHNYGGKTLNANRTYYISRSHPPMLASMALAILPFIQTNERKSFLKRVADAIAIEYEGFWKTDRYDEEFGLFRYGNIKQGELGLCPEVAHGERDAKGLSHYDKIVLYLRDLPPTDPLRLRFYDEIKNELTQEAIAGDRGMRESGFDASMQMGYFGLETMDFSPVCLNSLLYVQSHILGHMYKELKEDDKAQYFESEAAELKAAIQKYMWNEDKKLFSHFNHHIQKPSSFFYLTCVYPLWAGIATPQQAKDFKDNLNLFETPFGIRSTDQQTGCQWDSPFMWAPLVYFTVAGLQNYGFTEDARRIAQKFVDTVRRVNEETGANFEKYNAHTGDYRTDDIIGVGYTENVVGFGWTNGTILTLKNWLATNEPIEMSDITDLWKRRPFRAHSRS